VADKHVSYHVQRNRRYEYRQHGGGAADEAAESLHAGFTMAGKNNGVSGVLASDAAETSLLDGGVEPMVSIIDR
jgi:hypothetical protein